MRLKLLKCDNDSEGCKERNSTIRRKHRVMFYSTYPLCALGCIRKRKPYVPLRTQGSHKRHHDQSRHYISPRIDNLLFLLRQMNPNYFDKQVKASW